MNETTSSADCSTSAYHYVREGLVSGRYRSGQRLLAREIARAVGVSRTPVRDALGRLCQDGFVDQDLAGGFTVKSLTLADIEGLFDVRELLEQEAARRALQRLDAERLEGLRVLLAESERDVAAGNFVNAIAAARRFHPAIAGHAANHLLLTMIESISDRIHMVGVMLLERYPMRVHQVARENRAIFDALERRNEAALHAAVRQHVQESRALVFRR